MPQKYVQAISMKKIWTLFGFVHYYFKAIRMLTNWQTHRLDQSYTLDCWHGADVTFFTGIMLSLVIEKGFFFN